MVVTKRCNYCGYEWRPRGDGRRCPSCHRVLGETKVRAWEDAGLRLKKRLASHGWDVKSVGGVGAIDVSARKEGKRLLIDVKSGESYHIRRSQLKNLLAYRNRTTDVGFACEMDGKFYLLTLKEIL
ncbi:MAG: hypothetical protein DRN83_02115 [Hadesarchaea archaeon]|nr:MAG: hypothetical protein DRN83_02115 [Hadesarchaea archaeon]HDI13131.1 hypothetical protein [Hadesarchaea archaeon]